MKKLPKLPDLHNDPETAFKNDEFKRLMYQPTPSKWIKKHPIATKKNEKGEVVKADYVPTDKVEYMLDMVFQQWKVEIIQSYIAFNACVVHVRLWYWYAFVPEGQEGYWMFHDGIGAKSVQVDAGSNASNLGSIKDAAVQMAFPSAKSYAIKDAADHIGPLFGRDLNRKDNVAFTGAYTSADETPEEPKDLLVPPTADQLKNKTVKKEVTYEL